MIRGILCMVGRHRWQQHVNPGVGGVDGLYYVCAACGKEKMAWGPPSQRQVKGIAGGA
jgi:hypothetical protein